LGSGAWGWLWGGGLGILARGFNMDEAAAGVMWGMEQTGVLNHGRAVCEPTNPGRMAFGRGRNWVG
jgi:hypothetical protein